MASIVWLITATKLTTNHVSNAHQMKNLLLVCCTKKKAHNPIKWTLHSYWDENKLYILHIDFENYDWNTFHEKNVSTWGNILDMNQQYNCLGNEQLNDSKVGFKSSWYIYLQSTFTKGTHCFVHMRLIVLSTKGWGRGLIVFST